MVHRVFTIANLALLTIALYFGVAIFYAVLLSRLGGAPLSIPAATTDAPAEAEAPSQLADYQTIVERNLFNSGRQPLAGSGKTATPGVDVGKLKQTELKLKLWGTSTGRDGRTYAVIEDQKTREQALYRPGETIQNATVKLVLRQKVVLNVSGKDEVLVQEEPGVTKGAPMRPTRADAGPAVRSPEAESAQEVVVSQEQAEDALENLGDLLNQATFRPHLEDGKPAGISITGIKPNALFRKLRLRNGDIITGVNDQSIASVDDAVKAFGSLSTDGPIQVRIKRRGQEEVLEYKIE
jgi:general secretion pathway protein C